MSGGAINAVISNLVGAANGIAFVALLTAIAIPFLYRKGAITGSSLTLLICTQLTYFLITALNLGESSGMGRANPALISTLYLVGAILFVFFFYAHDRNVTIAQLREGISGHQAATTALSTQSAQLLSYLNALPDPVFAVNTEGAVVFFNSAFMKAFFPEQQWGNGASLNVDDLPTSVQSLIARCSFQEVAALGDTVTRTLSLPSRGRNGQVFQIRAFPLHIYAGSGSVVSYCLHDITPEMQLFKALARERDACLMGAHSANLAYEFGSILAGIRGITQHLAGDAAEDTDVAKYMRQTEELLDRADDLLRGMTAHQAVVDGSEGFDLAELLEAGRDEIESALPDGIKLKMNMAANKPYIAIGGKDEILSVVSALAANAGEASLPGGTVVLAASRTEMGGKEMIRVSVIDSGRGIPQEDMERVFSPFFTTKEGHKGMGLPIALSITAKHRGLLRLERSDELGTEFALYLPSA